LRLESLTFFILGFQILVRLTRERFAHVEIALVLFVDEVVRSRNVVVTVSFQTSYGVVFFITEVVNQSLKQIFLEGHLLKPWEHSRLANFSCILLLCSPHVWVGSNL